MGIKADQKVASESVVHHNCFLVALHIKADLLLSFEFAPPKYFVAMFVERDDVKLDHCQRK